MVLYLSTIFVAMLIIMGLNMLIYPESFSNYEIWLIVAVALSVVVEVLISAIGSFICLKAPAGLFNPSKKLYVVSKKEQRVYEKMRIKSWKDKVWDLGGLGGFKKSKLENSNSSEYLYRFIMESNRGMVGHILNCFLGFLVIFVLPFKYAFRIGVPVAIVGLVLNVLPTIVLRYNLPKLHIAYKRVSRLEARKTETPSSIEDEEESTQGA